jgi:hypothetical protein
LLDLDPLVVSKVVPAIAMIINKNWIRPEHYKSSLSSTKEKGDLIATDSTFSPSSPPSQPGSSHSNIHQ